MVLSSKPGKNDVGATRFFDDGFDSKFPAGLQHGDQSHPRYEKETATLTVGIAG